MLVNALMQAIARMPEAMSSNRRDIKCTRKYTKYRGKQKSQDRIRKT
jgi:hypothetical protein